MKTRKLFVVILALVLTLCMTATAFAGSKTVNDLTSEGGQNPVNIDVTGTYSDTHTSSTVYSVDISWGAMNFTYSITGAAKWNPATHEYDTAGESTGWALNGTEGVDNAITVKNHSNISVKAKLSFANAGNTAASVTGTFSNATLDLASAVDKIRDDENADNDKTPTATSTFMPTGTLGSEHVDNASIGTITITLE